MPGEDGFRVYILHEERCNPARGRQLWFLFITEDDLDWRPPEERTLLFPAFRLKSRIDPGPASDAMAQPAPDSPKAA